MKQAALAIALAGCYRPANNLACETTCPCPASLECGPDNICRTPGSPACSTIDAAMPDSIIPSDAKCYGNGLGVHICVNAGGERSFPTEAPTISTDGNCDALMLQPGHSALCVIVGTTITIDGTVNVTGTRPLVLLGTTSIVISMTGKLDGSSIRGKNMGPAANDASCSTTTDGAKQTTLASDGGGGGAGGSFGASGGAGGGGLKNNGGTPRSEPAPTYVRGGCKGGNGGDAIAGLSTGGAGGDGGGAIYLLAGTTIIVSGTLAASGEGGAGATLATPAGGGGGGAGGLIALDAPAVQLSGTVLALGGGGGGGGDSADTLNTPGAGGDPSDINGANGGGPSGNAGRGGHGASRAQATGSTGSFGGTSGPGNAGTGGGGGGGGAGHIFVFPPGQIITDVNVAPVTE